MQGLSLGTWGVFRKELGFNYQKLIQAFQARPKK